jgi:hypothetical protein
VTCTVVPEPIQATSLELGTLAVDQLPADCHSPSPAPPVYVSVQVSSAAAPAGSPTIATAAIAKAATATRRMPVLLPEPRLDHLVPLRPSRLTVCASTHIRLCIQVH